jgi:WD40 repeat protein
LATGFHHQKGVQVLDLSTGKATPLFAGTTRVDDLAFSDDGRVLGIANGQLHMWNFESRKASSFRHGFGAYRVQALAFAHQSPFVATAADGGEAIKLWNLSSGAALSYLGIHAQANSIAFSPDDRVLAAGATDHTVRLWEGLTGRMLAILTAHTDRVWGVAWSPDGKNLASCSRDGTIRVWDRAHWSEQQFLERDHLANYGPAVSPDNSRLALVAFASEREIRLCDRATGKSLKVFPTKAPCVGPAFSPDGQRLATCDQEGGLYVWHLGRGGMEQRWTIPQRNISELAFLANGQELLIRSKGARALLWKLTADGPSPCDYPEKGWDIRAISPDGRTALIVDDRQVGLGDLVSGHSQWRTTGDVEGAVFSPDGAVVAAASANPTAIRILNVAGSRPDMDLVAHGCAVWSLAFSPDGKTLASGDISGRVVLWNVASGQDLLTLHAYDGVIWGMTFTPDGRALLVNADGHVDQWLAADGPVTGAASR